MSLHSSAFGVVHLAKAVTDTDDPSIKSPIKAAGGKFDASKVAAKLRPAKLAALKAVTKV